MAEKNIGAVLVMTGDEIKECLERDYARQAVLHGHTSRVTRLCAASWPPTSFRLTQRRR